MSDSPTFICLTPVKNEAWILDRFLQCASTWADHIVVADQQSDDGSREIARSYEKVKLIDNDTPSYDEGARQKLLIDAGRQIPVNDRRVLIALDADEMLSANWMDSTEWEDLLAAEPGTVLRFQWANVGPDVSCAWVDSDHKPFGFVDDGSPHRGRRIHSPRIPIPESGSEMTFHSIKVLHYQYASWERMRSKQRWYQAWERLNNADKRPVTIFRQYHHMEAAIQNAGLVEDKWLRNYEARGVDMRSIPVHPVYHWDKELLEIFDEHGTEPFRKLNVWDADWEKISQSADLEVDTTVEDPRSSMERMVHDWLRRTQPYASSLPVRIVQKLLEPFGW